MGLCLSFDVSVLTMVAYLPEGKDSFNSIQNNTLVLHGSYRFDDLLFKVFSRTFQEL